MPKITPPAPTAAQLAADPEFTDAFGSKPGAWINVGSGGSAPAFSGTWVNFSAAYTACRFRKIDDIVHVEGVVKSGSVPSAVFNLPAGYRPTAEILLPAVASSGAGRIEVKTGGDFHVAAGHATFTAFSVAFSVL